MQYTVADITKIESNEITYLFSALTDGHVGLAQFTDDKSEAHRFKTAAEAQKIKDLLDSEQYDRTFAVWHLK